MPIQIPRLYLFHTNQKLILDPILGLVCMFNEFQTNNGQYEINENKCLCIWNPTYINLCM